ncbi:hypothetical protein CPC08DRAFT_727199 [Agrocybe pediades]|nr:hypothetical protein CPC08DRAFT_727199 [Agrocybe pediades]
MDITQTFNIDIGLIYVQAFYDIIKGLAPTLMTARLCLASTQQDTEVFSSSVACTLETCTTWFTPGPPADTVGGDVEMQSNVTPSNGIGQEENNGIMIIDRRDPTTEED